MSSSPGYLAAQGIEVANNARTVAYLQAGLGSPQFEITYADELCPGLSDIAFPLEVCDGLERAQANQLYANPIPTWRVPSTGAVPTAPVWYEAGFVAMNGNGGITGGAILPDPGSVPLTVRLAHDFVGTNANNRAIGVARIVNPGTANVGWIGCSLVRDLTGVVSLIVDKRLPNGGAAVLAQISATTYTQTIPAQVWLQVVFTAQGFTAGLYGSDPDVPGAPLILSGAYGYDPSPLSAWRTAAGVPETTSMLTTTEVGLVSASAGFQITFGVLTELDVIPGVPCEAAGTSYPGQGAWPAENLYPGWYGYFTNPGDDNAPWVDPAQPASYGYLGMILTDVEEFDSSETRSLDAAASGRGGILGPQQMAPKHLTFKGWIIAQGCDSMEYARRWLADVLAGEFCPGCDALELDILPLCGAPNANGLRRIYDTGLESFVLDTSDDLSCCYVTPVTFTMAVADPFLYTLPETVIASQALAPLATDTPAIPFESWLFASPSPICIPLADEGLGTDAAIVTLDGGNTGISGGLVYRSQGHYPQASMFPGECVYPADGTPQWDIAQCPFVFDISIGPDETFTVDSSRRRVTWQLSDGTVLNGSPKLALAPGQTIQWLDTCDGEDAEVCVRASANCTCDTSAAVTVATQHSER